MELADISTQTLIAELNLRLNNGMYRVMPGLFEALAYNIETEQKNHKEAKNG